MHLRKVLKLNCLLIIVIAGMLLAPAAHAQVEPASGSATDITATVTGRVFLDNVGEPNVVVEMLAWNPEGTTGLLATAITDSAGRYTINYVPQQPVSESNKFCFMVKPRKSIFEFEEISRINCITRDTLHVWNFTMLRLPILIVGGLTPFNQPQTGCPQFRLDGSSYNPGSCGGVEFAWLYSALRSNGWQVHTVMLNSSIQGTPALATQTSALRRGVNALKSATGFNKVIVLGHGIGGIVARRYIESRDYARDVAHLFTFGSPHIGNSLEDTIDVWIDALLPAFLASRGVPASLIPIAINAINNASVDRTDFLCTTNNFAFRFNSINTFNTPGMGQAALCETTASGMANFNFSFRPRRGLPYHLIQGSNPRILTDLNTLGRSMNAALPGNDDAFVQTTNATGFISSDPLDRLLTRDPNMDAVSANQRWYLNTNGASDSAFATCILPMFITRTISNPNCGTLVPVQAVSAMATEGEDEMSLAPAMTDADLIGQKTLLRSAVVSNTTTVMTQGVQLVESGPATFLASWRTGAVVFTMLDPNGQQITPKNANGDVQFETDGTRASYTFSTTQPGLYTMLLQAGDLPAGNNTINHFASIDSAYTLSATRSRNWLPPGGVVTITALFAGPTPIQSPVVKATIYSKSGPESVIFESRGSGIFRYVYTAKNTPGYVEMEIVATGKVNGVEIERNDNVSFTVYPDSFRLNGNYTEIVDPLGLTINAGINVSQGVSGTFRVTGVLLDSSGQQVAIATTMASTGEGLVGTGASDATFSVPLFFDGKVLHAAGKNGPFTLGRILVVDENEHAQVSADEANVFTTSAIDVSRFASAIFVPVLSR